MQVLIYVVAMEMQMSHKHDNGTNEYFQINLVPIDQSINLKKLKESFKDLPPPPPLHSPRLERNIKIPEPDTEQKDVNISKEY